MENAMDVMKREQRRYSVVHTVAQALDEIAALEVEARQQADKIIVEAEARAAQIVADALNEAQAMTDEVKNRLTAIHGETGSVLDGEAAPVINIEVVHHAP